MKELNIGKTIMDKRKEKGITQEDLAEYIGVSKASVSKWETGQSYPDIALLPHLASYFNISIDDLMNYSPQMNSKEIKEVYHRLAKSFATKSFDEAYGECEEIIKKYYACFPLLYKIAIVLLNHYMLADGEEKQQKIIEEITGLCKRIKEESDDISLCADADGLRANCFLILNKTAEVIDLLERDQAYDFGSDGALANAYLMRGQNQQAKEVMQGGIYQSVMAIAGWGPMVVALQQKEPEKTDKVLQRMMAFMDLFNVRKLNPNAVLVVCLSAAQQYVTLGEKQKALEYLKLYEEICNEMTFPLRLGKDDFFDAIDGWFQKVNIDIIALREEKLIRQSMVAALTENPVLNSLGDERDYKLIISKLKERMEK